MRNGQEIVLTDLTGGHSTGTTTQPEPESAPPALLPNDLQRHLDDQERDILTRALHETRGNRTAAAALLGLNLRQMRYRIARLGISVGGTPDSTDTDEPLAYTPPHG